MTAQQLFNKILTRISAAPPQTVTFLDAVNDVLEIVGTIMLDENSNMLKANGSVTLATGVDSAVLPDLFWGFCEQPYVSDAIAGTSRLVPLIGGDESYDNATPGKPESYEVNQATGVDSIRVYPVPDADYTVKFSYKVKPVVTSLTDDLPFNGLFDSAIGDILIRTGNAGGWVTISADWSAIEEKILWVLRTRTPRMLAKPNIKVLWA